MKDMHPFTMQRYAAVILAAAVVLTTAGCQVVHVIDQHGNPVAGVEVRSQYAGVEGEAGEGPSAVTDRLGNATLARPAFQPDPTWLTVHKQGYMPQGVDYPVQWYSTIIMPSVGPTAP